MDTSTGLIAVLVDEESASFPRRILEPLQQKSLLEWNIQFLKSCREIVRIAVASPTPHVLAEAHKLGVHPVERPASSPVWVAMRAALLALERKDGEDYRIILAANPFMPFRDPMNVMECFQRLIIDGEADGIAATNGSMIFRKAGYIRDQKTGDVLNGNMLPYDMNEMGSIVLNTPDDFKKADELIAKGLVFQNR